MQVTELRIGNWVEGYHDKYTRDIVDIDILASSDGDGYIGVEGIPLTEEWLLKFGFEEDDKEAVRNQRCFGIGQDSDRLYFSNSWILKQLHDNSWIILSHHCQYVHQLQNLYFALTGTEL